MARLVSAATPASPSPYLKLFGPFAATDAAGRDRALPRKAQALVCFLLALRGRSVTRDDAAALLWDDTQMAQARQSLRQSLYVLRNVFPKAIVADSETLHLSGSPRIQSDFETFERLSRTEDRESLAQADRLYRGPLLQGIRIRAASFEDWLSAERQRLSLAHLRVVERLARLALQAGDDSSAIAYARRLVDLDGNREESGRLLMESLVAAGDQGAALIEYSRLKRTLRSDLDVDPEPETRALADRIRAGNRTTILNPPEAERASGRRINPSVGHTGLDEQWCRPRVLARPFRNLSGKSRDDGIVGAALAEDVALALARDDLLHVQTCDLPHSARVAGVGAQSVYLVCGSIRTTPRSLRIAIQLADAATGRCLWSGYFDRSEAYDPLQDIVPAQIAARLSYAIRTIELERSRHKPVDALGIVQVCLRATAAARDGRAGNEAALAMLHSLLDRAPETGAAHALAARCYHVQRLMGWRAPNDPRLAEGVLHAQKAVALSPSNSDALWMAGLALMNIKGDLQTARSLVEEATTSDPSSANARIAATFVHCHLGEAAAALSNARSAAMLNPFDKSHHVLPSAAATAHFVAGDYAAANAACDLALLQSPGYAGALRMKIAAASLLDRADDAAMSARQLLKREPHASIGRMRSYWQWLAPNAPDALDATIEGWRRAGMPE